MGRVLQPFEYYEPTTLAAALALLAVPGVVLLAGGCYLVSAMRCRIVRPSRVVSIMKVAGLDDLNVHSENGLRVQAQVKLREIENHALVRRHWTALYDAVTQIRPAHIRNMGTLAGNACSAVPFLDVPVALAALRAQLRIVSATGDRKLSIEDLYTAPQKTAVGTGEIVHSIYLPPTAAHSGSALRRILKAPRREGDLGKVNASCYLALDAQTDTVADATLVVGCCSFGPVRIPAAEAQLQGAPATDETFARAADIAAMSIAPMTNAAWVETTRQAFVRVLVRDALAAAARRARGKES